MQTIYTPEHLMALHARVLFTHDAQQRLVKVNEPWPTAGPAARFFLGRPIAGKNIYHFRHDMPAELVQALSTLCEQEPLPAVLAAAPVFFADYMQLLAAGQVETGPSYLIPEQVQSSLPLVTITPDSIQDLTLGSFDWLLREVTYVQPCIGVIDAGRVVSLCRSVRVTQEAHEAGLETDPQFRGKGYAAKAVAGWATAVRAIGALPMYSTSWDNTASQRVADKLGLICYGTAFTIS